MRDYAAAPANDGPIAPAACMGTAYFRGLTRYFHGGWTKAPCWRTRKVGGSKRVCLRKTDHPTGLCDKHRQQMEDW